MQINPVDLPEFGTRLAEAVGLGAVVGFERQWHQKMAGLKTNALVALGSAGFVLFGLAPGQINGSMIAAQIVSGIGFLGAGVIMRDGASVHGLNTAATVWCSAMVGALAGFGLFQPAAFAAMLVLGTNLALRPVANRLNARVQHSREIESNYTLSLTVIAGHAGTARGRLLAALEALGMTATRMESTAQPGQAQVIVVVHVSSPTTRDAAVEQALAAAAAGPEVVATTWRVDRAQPEA
jgi:putative Mg2+ transporter-C (MgtC) family protein